MKAQAAFTLIELLVVLTIVALLAMVAIPRQYADASREQVQESLQMLTGLKKNVEAFHAVTGRLPERAEDADLPPAEKIIGNYVSAISLQNGAFHIHFGNKATQVLQGKILSVRAALVADSPQTPLAWVCGYAAVPAGMAVAAADRSTVGVISLPVECRGAGSGAH